LSELRLIAAPPRRELLAGLRPRLGHLVPGARVIAERILGADALIDFVMVDPVGRLVLVLVGEHGDDLELVGQALAQRAWVQARRGDWLQLAPSLGLRADSPVQVMLLCPAYGVASRAAVEALGRDVIAAGQYRCVQSGDGFDALVEHADFDRPEQTPAVDPAPARPAPQAASTFRTGLTDADLGITSDERREFE
jgi:hypothetical protein